MRRICRKGKYGMKERVGDGKLIIISMTVSGINDRIRFYSYYTRCYFNVRYRIVSAQILSYYYPFPNCNANLFI